MRGHTYTSACGVVLLLLGPQQRLGLGWVVRAGGGGGRGVGPVHLNERQLGGRPRLIRLVVRPGGREPPADQPEPAHRQQEGQPGDAEGVVDAEPRVDQPDEHGPEDPGQAAGPGHQAHPDALGPRPEALAEDRLDEGDAEGVADRREPVAVDELADGHAGRVAAPLLGRRAAEPLSARQRVLGLVAVGCNEMVARGLLSVGRGWGLFSVLMDGVAIASVQGVFRWKRYLWVRNIFR